MINTIIIDDNIEYIKSLINSVISDLKEIKITHILTNGLDALDFIKNNSIDLILLDLKIPDIDGIHIIKEIEKMNLLSAPKIVIISGEIDYISSIKDNIIILDMLNKTSNIETIKYKFKNIIDDFESNQDHKNSQYIISNELINLGYNFKYKGTHYIFDSILYIYQTNNFDLLDNIEKNVYRYISLKYKKSVNNIKTNIIKSTQMVINKKYTNLTPKTVINIVLLKLLNRF